MPIMIAWEERDRHRPWRLRVLSRLAVAAARPVVRLPPDRLRALLARIARGARPATAAEADAALRSVLSASLPLHGVRACLPRSVSAALLCRLRGSWPTWCTGVTVTPPFAAHAWIEVDGVPVSPADRDDARIRMVVVGPGGATAP